MEQRYKMHDVVNVQFFGNSEEKLHIICDCTCISNMTYTLESITLSLNGNIHRPRYWK